MTTNKRVTYNVQYDKKLKIEKLAVEASQKIGRIVNWTELMEVLIEDYAKDAQATLVHRETQKKA